MLKKINLTIKKYQMYLKKIVHYVTRGESSRFFPRVGLVPERQDFSRGCVEKKKIRGKIFSRGQ